MEHALDRWETPKGRFTAITSPPARLLDMWLSKPSISHFPKPAPASVHKLKRHNYVSVCLTRPRLAPLPLRLHTPEPAPNHHPVNRRREWWKLQSEVNDAVKQIEVLHYSRQRVGNVSYQRIA
jgi:hypothetical protein